MRAKEAAAAVMIAIRITAVATQLALTLRLSKRKVMASPFVIDSVEQFTSSGVSISFGSVPI